MDWAKAKTILIAVFLTIDIFLAYMIIGGNTSNIGYVDSEKIQRITTYLAEKNIEIKAQIPGRKIDMPSVTVKYELFKKEDVVKRIFSDGVKPTEVINGRTIELSGKDKKVRITDSRELNYEDVSIIPAETIDEKACKKHIEEFLNRLGLKDDTSIRKAEDIKGYKRFLYGQSFKGTTIYNSIMEFYVNDAGVYRARIVWFETIKQLGKKADVISPVIALLSVPEYYKDSVAKAKEVLEVQQGYYFGTGASSQVDVSVVEEGTAFPVWKITTDRDIIYINSYNEKVEGVEKARK